MLTAALSEVKSLVDKRFLLNAFFPCLVFAAIAGLLVSFANGGVGHWVAVWNSYSGTVQAAVAAAFVTGVFVLAAFMLSNQLLITRLYEGHFGPRFLKTWGQNRQQHRSDKTNRDKELRFPHQKIRSTALGNVLGAAEDYPGRAYGINALVVWPRLFLVLPDAFLTSAADALDTMQFLLLISFLSGLLVVGGGIYAAVESLGPATYLIVVVGGIGLSWMAYQSAVQAAIPYGLHIRAAFDLYRNDLLVKLHRALPATSDEEKRTWQDVATWLSFGEAAPVRYAESASK